MNRSLQTRAARTLGRDLRQPTPLRRSSWSVALAFACIILTGSTAAHAQSLPTATRAGDLQFGAGFAQGSSDYNQNLSYNRMNLKGAALYAAFDFNSHFGFEADFHQTRPSEDSTAYQRIYEIGPRLHWNYGRFIPYGKFLVGRGVFNYPGNIANLAYNTTSYGGGVDYNLTSRINLRGDYEYQNWMGFPLGTLHPGVATIGIAYHFRQSRLNESTRR